MNKGQRISQLVEELERRRHRIGAGRNREASLLSRFLSLLERTAILRGARCSGTPLVAHDEVGGRQLFQGFDPGAPELCAPAKAIPATNSSEATGDVFTWPCVYFGSRQNLAPYAPRRHSFKVGDFLFMLRQQVEAILSSDHRVNPWKPETGTASSARSVSCDYAARGGVCELPGTISARSKPLLEPRGQRYCPRSEDDCLVAQF